MNSSIASVRSVSSTSRTQWFRTLAAAGAALVLSTSVFAQADATAPAANGNGNGNGNGRQRRNNANQADAAGNNNGGNGGNNNGGGRGNFDPAQMQERMMTALKEQFGVADDAEWTVISERITKVSELRRNGMGGGFGGLRGGGGGGGGGNRPNRPGATANPELDSLRAAITDKLPDAEIKSRLERVRDARKENEAKLAKAQEELRAVLSVRQEAVAVMAGLLP